MIKNKVKYWLLEHQPQGGQVKNQYQMVWFSLPLAIACLLYLAFNTTTFQQHALLLALFSIFFVTLQILAAIGIKNKPISPWRISGLIALNIGAVLLVLIADNNVSSYIYIAFFAILFVSILWFGLNQLILGFVLVLLGQFLIALFLGISNLPLFITHILTLSIIPIVAMLVHKQAQSKSDTSDFDMMNQIPVPMFVYHLVKEVPTIRFANSKTCQTFACEHGELINTPVHHIAATNDAEEITRCCIYTLRNSKNKKSHTFFIRGYNKQGEAIKIMCVASQIMWHDEHVGLCFLLDITQNEQLRSELNNSMHEGYINTLVAGVVHDFRNVLTNIIGSAEVLEFTLTDETSQKQLRRIIQSGEQGSATITQLLEFNTINKQSKPDKNINIQSVLQNISSLLRIQLPSNIQLECTVDEHLPQIQLTFSELEQILINLINNAKQAITSQGKISIQVTSHTVQPSENETLSSLKISISDNGCGIKDKDIPFVTNNFWRSQKEKGGIGLGLAMVKRIVNLHNGTLNIISTIGIGTTIAILIPEHQTNKEKIGLVKTPIIEQKEMVKSKSCSILLVDDSLEILAVYRMLLETMGHQVYDASDADKAIEIHKKEPIDLLITDLKMPNMDGIELTMLLREKQPFLPVLMITAYDKIEKEVRLQDLNINLLLKPGTFNKLNQAIFEIQTKNLNFFS